MIWILSFLPNWIFHLIVLAGVLGLLASQFFRFIPFVSTYTMPIKVASIFALVVGIWFEGGISNNDAWLAKVKEMELKVAKAEAQSAEYNTKLTAKIAENNKIIKENTNANQKAISKYVTDECRMSNVAVSLHNSASRGEVPSSTIGTITGTSQVKTAELLGTVTENYGTYHEVTSKLKAWQEWYKEQKQIFESVK
jgi:hypothetical protein